MKNRKDGVRPGSERPFVTLAMATDQPLVEIQASRAGDVTDLIAKAEAVLVLLPSAEELAKSIGKGPLGQYLALRQVVARREAIAAHIATLQEIARARSDIQQEQEQSFLRRQEAAVAVARLLLQVQDLSEQISHHAARAVRERNAEELRHKVEMFELRAKLQAIRRNNEREEAALKLEIGAPPEPTEAEELEKLQERFFQQVKADARTGSRIEKLRKELVEEHGEALADRMISDARQRHGLGEDPRAADFFAASEPKDG